MQWKDIQERLPILGKLSHPSKDMQRAGQADAVMRFGVPSDLDFSNADAVIQALFGVHDMQPRGLKDALRLDVILETLKAVADPQNLKDVVAVTGEIIQEAADRAQEIQAIVKQILDIVQTVQDMELGLKPRSLDDQQTAIAQQVFAALTQ